MAHNPNYFDVTPEIEALSALSLHNSSIDPQDYVKYDVKRGLRDLNGKGVVAGLTEISDIVAKRVVDGEEFHDFFVETAVRFADISPAEIEAYTALAEPYDKAGGYAIQGQGAFLIREIRGSYTNVVGLPVAELLEVLKEWGAVAPNHE